MYGCSYKDAAHLEYNVPTPIYFSTEYGPAIGTEQERNLLWEALDISDGVITISDAITLWHLCSGSCFHDGSGTRFAKD